jgi:hypothetical protein
MGDLVVITPSRGRPRQLNELAHVVAETTSGRVEVVGLVDDDDPKRVLYKAMFSCNIWTGPRRSLTSWTNHAAAILVDQPAGEGPRYLASLGDDHVPRTKDWDLKLIAAIEAMDGPGIAYGNDLFQGAGLPTAWVVSADVVRAVGWMMLPTCEHMYVDAAVRALGDAAGRLAYRGDVVIEHLHPLAGKADWDESYRESNADARYAADRAAYDVWRRDGLEADAAKVQALRYPPGVPDVNRFELVFTATAEVVKAEPPGADGND